MAAVRSIQKAIHINPDNHTLWRLLAAAILKFIPDFGLAAVSSAQHAYDLDFTIKVLRINIQESLFVLISLCLNVILLPDLDYIKYMIRQHLR